jgi:hypothetical protein
MTRCAFAPGWRCIQPGSPGRYEIEGPIPIPGPDGTRFTVDNVPQGWGEVPLAQSITCWCANVAGTFANESFGCVAEPCPYRDRCLDRGEPNNGTVCIVGSEGTACAKCSRRWYRFRDECRPCPTGVPVSVILLGLFLGFFIIVLGPKLAQLSSPQAVALLRNLVMYMQYLALSFTIRLRWPPGLLFVFRWLRALTDGIDLAAPECITDTWSCACCRPCVHCLGPL